MDPFETDEIEAAEKLWERSLADPPSERLVAIAHRIYDAMAVYHRHTVIGMENIPKGGPCLLALNHSLATYDVFMVEVAVHRATGRLPRGLGDRQIFRWPGLADLATAFGAVEGAPGAAQKLLAEGELVVVAPGGMREALRPSSERYMLRWRKRKGFVKLAIEMRAPIVLGACPRADDLFTVYESALTAQVYQRYRFPMPFVRGFGPTLLPRPVKLTHVLSEPLYPPTYEGHEPPREVVEHFHNEVVGRMQKLMEEGLSHH